MIKKIKITNFRNLHNVEYNSLGKINEITGSNGVGKTSVIDAILWVLINETIMFKDDTDKNINIDDPYQILEVEIKLNDDLFKRKYGYILNDDKTTTLINLFFKNNKELKGKEEYIKSIYKSINITDDLLNRIKDIKIDLLKFLILPSISLENVDEKIFRALISKILNIDTINELLTDKKYLSIKDDILKYDTDYNGLIDFYNQKIITTDKNIKLIDSKISLYSTINFDEEKYNRINNEIKDLTTKSFVPSNDNLTLLEKDKEKLNKEKEQIFLQIQNRKKDIIKVNNEELNALSKEINKNKAEVKKIYDQMTNLKNENIRLASVIKYIGKQIIKEEDTSFERMFCPNCHTLLNQAEEEKFLSKKQKTLNEYNSNLESYKKQNSSITDQLKSLIQKYDELCALVNNQMDEYKKKELDAKQTIQNQKYDEYKTSIDNINDQLTKVNEDIEKAKIAYVQEQNDFYNNKTNELSELKSQLNTLTYNKEMLLKLNDAKKSKGNQLSLKQSYENKLSLVKDFIDNEILLLNKYTKKIFGDDISFLKITNNDDYKKISFMVYLDKNYESYNTANRLSLSIMIIDKLKQFIGGISLPIIFDISDNIGNSILKNICEKAESQLFFTSVIKEDGSKRKLISLN